MSWKTTKQIPHCPKSGRVPCEKLPRKPRQKNAIALPSQRGTDDVNNQAEFRVKNFPANPDNKNAIAVPPERCTADVNNQAEYRVKNFPRNPEEKKRGSSPLPKRYGRCK